MLDVSGLFAGYGKRAVLNDLEVDVGPGQVAAVIGANGAGKTTLLRVLSGQLRPTRGRVHVLDRDVSKSSPSQLVKSGLAHVPEGRHVFPGLSVRDHLLLGAYIHDKTGMKRSTQDRLQMVFDLFPRLRERVDQRGGSLSGGEQQMLVIGRALMSNPKLLLIDEPSLGLAPLAVKTIMVALAELRTTEVSVLLVEQNAVIALDFSDRAFVMEAGRVALSGSCSELRNDPRIRDAYLGEQKSSARIREGG